MNNDQKHITAEYVEVLDTLSQHDSKNYVKLLEFAENVNIERFKYRLNQYYSIASLISDKKITDFESFIDLEVYILNNYKLHVLAISDVADLKEYNDIDFQPVMIELFNKYVNELTGSNRDKIFKLIKIHETDRYKCYNFRALLEDLITWYKNIQIFRFFGGELEKFDSLKNFTTSMRNIEKIKNAYNFFKLIKPELAKNITNKKDFLKQYYSLKFDNEFYLPLIEHSHKYTDINLFFNHLKGMEVKMKMQEVFDSLEKNCIKLIHYDNEEKTIIAHVESFEQIQKIGATSWCLTNHLNDWVRYTYECHFVIYWIFGNSDNNTETNMYGICLNKLDLKIQHCQNKNNSNTKHDFKWEADEEKALKEYFNGHKNAKALTVNKLDNEKPIEKSLFKKIIYWS